MWFLTVLFFSLVTSSVNALYVTAGSPCATTCDYGNGTGSSDLVCSDTDFVTDAKGQLLKQCLECQGQSLYINGSRNDEYWFMFHMKYLQESCLIDTSIPHAAAAANCATECSPLRTVLDTLWINQQPYLAQYDYCTLDANAYPTYAPDCARCLQAQQGTVITGNMVETMANACASQPLAANKELVSTSRDLFNTTRIALAASTSTSVTGTATAAATSPVQSSSNNSSGSHGLSAGAAAGIGIGVAAALIAAVAAFVFFMRKRKRSRSAKHVEAPVQLYSFGGDVKDTKRKQYYKEMPEEAHRPEIYSHETLEADGRPVEQTFPVAELPGTSHR